MAKFEPLTPPGGGFLSVEPPKPPRCPVCDGVVSGWQQHEPGATCISCDPMTPGQSHRRYEPCLHVVEVDVGPGCCDACKGQGGSGSGPCFDCYNTGHTHPETEDCTP